MCGLASAGIAHDWLETQWGPGNEGYAVQVNLAHDQLYELVTCITMNPELMKVARESEQWSSRWVFVTILKLGCYSTVVIDENSKRIPVTTSM